MKKKMNLRQFAVLTGVSIVVMTLVAGGTMGLVFAPLFEMNADEFAQEVPELQSNYFFGILGWTLILITDILASWGLYGYYANKNKTKAVIMGSLRLIYSGILLIAIVQLVRSYFAMNTESGDVHHAYDLLLSFQSIWEFGLIIFGFHLLYLSQLVCENGWMHRIIAALLFCAGIGYIGSNTADLFISNYAQFRAQIEVYFILPMVFGEFGLAIWLLVSGGKSNTLIQKQCASESC